MRHQLLIICLLGTLSSVMAQPVNPRSVQANTGPSFSIEAVLSAPYCSDLRSAGNRVVWVVNERGVRNIYTATFPNPQPRPLTNNRTDDGQELGELTLSPDGRWLAYVRGEGKNSQGVNPNPGSDPAGAEQAIYLLPTDGVNVPAPVRVGLGNQPLWSPDGSPKQRQLVFSRGGQLFHARLADLTNSKTRKEPALLFMARGSQGEARFSPDGRRLAFSSNRGYHSLIGVYDFEQKRIDWIAPGVDRDGSPVWSPDGQHLAFIRVPGQRHGELVNVMGGNPFAVWVAPSRPDSLRPVGQGRELWHSPGDDGGFAQYYPTEPLRWTATNRLLFFSEHTGWMHVFALDPTSPGQPVDLTPGNAETEETHVTADGTYLYYSSNQNDADRRHLWRVNLRTQQREPLTSADLGTDSVTDSGSTGIETDPVVAGETLVYRSASWNRPTGIAYRSLAVGGAQQPDTSAERGLFPTRLPAQFPVALLTEPQPVTFAAADGVVVHGQLFLPASKPSKAPAVLFMHGGPIRQMLLGWHYRGTYYANAYAMNQYLASQGYVVLSVNYRAGIGYGRAFRRAERQGPRGASEYGDILAAARYLQTRPEVDPLKLGLWGGSYGGYLTALGLARNSDLFACGVDLHGVHDWSWRGNMFTPGGNWGIGEAEMKEALASSPNANLAFWRSPCLFIHGDDDRNVAFAETVDLVQKLRARNVPTEVLVLPDEVHGFLLHRSWLTVYSAMAQFLRKHLPLTRSH